MTDQGGHLILHNQERTEDTYSQKDKSHEEPVQCGESICVTHEPPLNHHCVEGVSIFTRLPSTKLEGDAIHTPDTDSFLSVTSHIRFTVAR